MKKTTRITALLLALLMCFSLLGTGAWTVTANAADDIPLHLEVSQKNPLYEHLTLDIPRDTSAEEPPQRLESAGYSTSVDECGEVIREAMKTRKASVTVYYNTPEDITEDEWKSDVFAMVDAAFEHTGDPKEGDYIRWQFYEWGCEGSGYYAENNTIDWDITFDITYYTTASQENQVDDRVDTILDELNVYDQSDYVKVRAVYDFICENITYDYENLNDDSYYLKYTAYAGLFHDTCVCQGYALIFYRLALELGVDARLIAGDGGGPHGWNIVELDNKYYNLDSTWDAGMSTYNYFLLCPANFDKDHTRYDEYNTSAFHKEYPMASKDYDISSAPCAHSYTSKVTKEATCTADGVRTYTCSKCGASYTETIKATGHSYGAWTDIKAPTCTEKGTQERTCSKCDTTETRTVAALGHTEVIDKAVAATCTADGKTQGKHCSVCGTVLTKQEVVPALGHDWDDGTITTQPTPSAPGVRTYHCSRCSETRTESVEYVDPATAPVVRIAGSNRCTTAYATANKLKEVLGVDKFNVIIIANGDNFADALAGSYLAAMKDAPILLYRNGFVDDNLDYIQKNLSSGGIVYILGGTAAVPADMADALTGAGIQVKRLSGNSRFATNLEILEEAGISGDEILIATGWNFADSLSASATGLPILMVNSVNNTLTDEQIAFLQENEGYSYTIIGGTSAVSTELENAIESVIGKSVDRVYGNSREATSAKVAERYFGSPSQILLAYSRNFPDGLCGGPLAYALGAPLLLTNVGTESAAADYVADNGIDSGIILGGTSVVSDNSARIIFDTTAEFPVISY